MARHRHGSALLVALFVLVFVPAARSADATWPVPRGPSHEPAPYRYDPAAWKAVPHDFLDDAAACILYAGTSYLVEADGTVETITHEITRLNGRKGVEKLGEYRNIVYDPAYQKLTLNEARIHKADGRTVAVEPRHVQLRDVGHRLPGLRPRQAAHHLASPPSKSATSSRSNGPCAARTPNTHGQFFTRYTFGDDTYPVVRDELRVRLPKGKPLKYAADRRQARPEGHRRRRRRAPTSGRRPTAASCRRTTTCRRRRSCACRSACSTFASWEEVGQWKQQLRATAGNAPPDVRQRRATR